MIDLDGTCGHAVSGQHVHQHLVGSEAEWSDELAARRNRGELNPQTWPPVVDGDAFEVTPAGAPIGDATAGAAPPVPDGMTLDDLD